MVFMSSRIFIHDISWKMRALCCYCYHYCLQRKIMEKVGRVWIPFLFLKLDPADALTHIGIIAPLAAVCLNIHQRKSGGSNDEAIIITAFRSFKMLFYPTRFSFQSNANKTNIHFYRPNIHFNSNVPLSFLHFTFTLFQYS